MTAWMGGWLMGETFAISTVTRPKISLQFVLCPVLTLQYYYFSCNNSSIICLILIFLLIDVLH